MVYTKKHGAIRRSAATLSSGSAGGVTGGGSTQAMAQSPLYYDYRWSTPDKFYYPRNRVVANAIWREIYKRDPAIATGTDMYAEMPWSEFGLGGIEDKAILHVYEDMFNTLDVVPKCSAYTKDFLITGELVLHHIFDSTDGIWNRVIPHDPNYIKVEGVGLALDQPLLSLIPTPEIKRMINSPDPRVRKLQKLLPTDVVNAFRADRVVPLDSLNTLYLARLASSNNLRGDSLYSRVYRVVMYEDFIVNASLAVAQRNAAPLRIFKLGDPNTGWLPDEDDEASFAEMLSMAEADPLAAIVMHHNVSCELVGVSDRVLLISREWDYIERVKLMALGVSKSFLVGESSFASAVAGLQTLMDRLGSLRHRFTREWLIKKICEPIAKIQGFYKRPTSELSHWIRVKKPTDEKQLIVPQIKWRKNLESNQDVAILNIWRDMKERGIISERSYAAGAGVDLDAERKNISEEKKYKESHPEIYGVPGQQAPGGKPPAGGGAPQRPGAPGVPGAPVPGVPGGSSGHARNPYKRHAFRNELEYRLDEIADTENKVDVRDVIATLEEVQEEEPENPYKPIIANLPPADNNLLSGE